jgi:hypothetical protein
MPSTRLRSRERRIRKHSVEMVANWGHFETFLAHVLTFSWAVLTVLGLKWTVSFGDYFS